MDNKIESFLRDIHALPGEELDKNQLEANLEVLLSVSPKIAADDTFKHKLRIRLSNIIEFKQSNTHVTRIGYLKFLLPIFACFIFIVGIFAIIDIKIPGSGNDYSVPAVSENAATIDPSLSPEEVASQIDEEETKQKQLTKKQQILEKAKLKKLAEEEGSVATPLSDQQIHGEQNTPVVENTLRDIAIPADTSDTQTQGTQAPEGDDAAAQKAEPETPENSPEEEYDDAGMSEESADSMNNSFMVDSEESEDASDEDYDGFELFCKDNLGTILETEEERVCDLGEGKICTEMEVNTETCEIE